jgi:hypothetical protein
MITFDSLVVEMLGLEATYCIKYNIECTSVCSASVNLFVLVAVETIFYVSELVWRTRQDVVKGMSIITVLITLELPLEIICLTGTAL